MKIFPLFLIVSVLLIAGCTSQQPPQPTAMIISPVHGQTITGPTISVEVSATNIKLAPANGTAIPGEGHFHVWIDNTLEQKGANTTFIYNNVAPGQHTVKIELHRGDHSAYDGTAKSVTFTVIEGNTTITGPVKEFNVTAKQFEFIPSTITVNKGDTVVLHITSTDVEHGLSLPLYNIIETLPPGVTKTVTFTADQAGEFNFFCSVFCGSGHQSMRGKLIVNP